MNLEPTIKPRETRARLVQFIEHEVARAGLEKAVVGLSGGVDSSLTAYLAVEALGLQHVWGIGMPYNTSSRSSIEDARLVTSSLNIHFDTIEITPQIDLYFERFPEADRVRRGNKMARERMSILYDQSYVLEALVVGSSNRTEGLLGYTTLWGDMACAIAPLGALFKTQVRQLAREVGVPERIIAKTPSAELWPGQTDEGELGFAYADVDRLLYGMLDLGLSDEQLVEEGFSPDFISRVREIMRANEFKRRMPLVPELD